MNPPKTATIDGNEAAASIAYRLSEVIAIYPITPASPMGELADEWAAKRRPNLWGAVPDVVEMQSEAGAAGAVHGALQAGAHATTFTASQGLLLMLPNMYKIAGELNAFCMHVAARTVATHALSIFGDHSDVMACRGTGFALLASASVQEAHDLALVAHAATLRSRVPFLHFFDGFRTSHEIAKISMLDDEDVRFTIDEADVRRHRERGLTPDRPVLRGSAQNPDAFFQAREACNPFYDALAGIVRETMDRFAERAGRRYRPFDYVGHPEAERVVVIMGSGGETAQETVEWLAARGERVGAVKVRLYRPFSVEDFAAALPASVEAIVALDRTKEPGAIGDPLHLDVVAALAEARRAGWARWKGEPLVLGGRYGLSSKEFRPAMVEAALDELRSPSPRNRFTLGIVDDVTHRSLEEDADFDIEPDDVSRAIFFGLGSDGTVGANKNSIGIIGDETDLFAQAYFVYDSKKAGARTVSHLRFGPRPIRSAHLIRRAHFVACHQFDFLDRVEMLDRAAEGATFLLNSPFGPEATWDRLPLEAQEAIVEKKLKLHVVDADRIAREAGLGRRINSVMQTCFFALSGVIERDRAIAAIERGIEKTYGRKGQTWVERNRAAVARALDRLHEVDVPASVTATRRRPPVVADEAPDFVKKVTALMMADRGDLLPVSAFPPDGTWPLGTAQWEKRRLAREIPVWDADICIQCNQCALVCPHAAIRAKIYEPVALDGAPPRFASRDFRSRELPGLRYTIQVAPEDCTGCTLCVNVCPAKDKSNPRHKAIDMAPLGEHLEVERENFSFFLDLPEIDRKSFDAFDHKSSQFLEPLFEFSGACPGCGETPYLKLLTQLFGDRALIANATGCSSIYGGNLPTTPYRANRDGRGPAWSNSLFEDNAEFGLGLRLAVDAHRRHAERLALELAGELGDGLVEALLGAKQSNESEIAAQRERVEELRRRLARIESDKARRLEAVADYLVWKSVWLVGGDGWAYDIGYGGLDHVLSMDRNINVLVLDTEVYSNTGGQQSKATPLGAAAKFAAAGKAQPKKDLGMIAMTSGWVYVARVAFGAKMAQTTRAFLEAEAYPGPSIIIAYSPCIAHGYDLCHNVDQQKRLVDSGLWPLYRFDPRRIEAGEPPLVLDSREPKIPVEEFMRNEARFLMAERLDPDRFKRLMKSAQASERQRFSIYQQLAGLRVPSAAIDESAAEDGAPPNGAGE